MEEKMITLTIDGETVRAKEGTTILEAAKQAVELRKHNGAFPSINVFIALLHIKQIYVEHIKAVAYVKKEIPPINQGK